MALIWPSLTQDNMTTNSAKKRATQKAFRLTKKSAFKLAKKVANKVIKGVPVAKKVVRKGVKKGLSFQRKTNLAGLILDPLPQGLGDSTNKQSKVVNIKKQYDKEIAWFKKSRKKRKRKAQKSK